MATATTITYKLTNNLDVNRKRLALPFSLFFFSSCFFFYPELIYFVFTIRLSKTDKVVAASCIRYALYHFYSNFNRFMCTVLSSFIHCLEIKNMKAIFRVRSENDTCSGCRTNEILMNSKLKS